MAKVYVVTGNWCDDTWIRCVCNSKAIANAIADTHDTANSDPKTTSYFVEEHELTDPIPHRTITTS